MEIVLVEPEIPGNTGNIARLCAANHMTLHLVEPLGFSIVKIHKSLDEVYEQYKDRRFWYATTKAAHTHAEVQYEIGDMLVFGKETKGLPEEIVAANPDTCIRIPMIDEARSLNLSNAVAIIAYEAMRQLDFPDLQAVGPGVSIEV